MDILIAAERPLSTGSEKLVAHRNTVLDAKDRAMYWRKTSWQRFYLQTVYLY